jgi:hypothetical protein
VNEHLSPRARTVVACIGIKQRAKGVRHFLDAVRRDPSPHTYSALGFHAAELRRRADIALADARDDATRARSDERRRDARRMG